MSCTYGFLNHVTGLCPLCLNLRSLGALDGRYLNETVCWWVWQQLCILYDKAQRAVSELTVLEALGPQLRCPLCSSSAGLAMPVSTQGPVSKSNGVSAPPDADSDVDPRPKSDIGELKAQI